MDQSEYIKMVMARNVVTTMTIPLDFIKMRILNSVHFRDEHEDPWKWFLSETPMRKEVFDFLVERATQHPKNRCVGLHAVVNELYK